MLQHIVAALAKDYGHYLRAAPRFQTCGTQRSREIIDQTFPRVPKRIPGGYPKGRLQPFRIERYLRVRTGLQGFENDENDGENGVYGRFARDTDVGAGFWGVD